MNHRLLLQIITMELLNDMKEKICKRSLTCNDKLITVMFPEILRKRQIHYTKWPSYTRRLEIMKKACPSVITPWICTKKRVPISAWPILSFILEFCFVA